MASEKWLAGCLYAAAGETDGAAREQKMAECMEQYKARATANDAAYERSQGAPVPPPMAPDPQAKRMHDAEVDKYVQRLKDPDAGVAFTATYKLKDLKDLRAVPPLLETLKGHKDYYTRLGAAVALGEMKACDAVPALIEAMDDKADLVRTGAAEALEIITDHEVRSAVGASSSERSAIEEEWKIWWRENEASVRQRLGQSK